jgi:hypothetical protein
MQFIQFTAARADTGQVLGYAKVTVYLTGTSTLAALFNAAGTSIANPTTADATGLVGVAAVNGSYDGVVTSADGSYSSPTILKLQLFDLAAVTQALAAGTFAGMIAKIKTTLALLNADLVATAGQLALVYADGTASNNDLYVKLGASGAGSWQGPLGFVSNQIAASVASATASAATASSAASAAGSRLRNGTVNPLSTDGSDGDFFLNTATTALWGPKASGAWPGSGVALKGADSTVPGPAFSAVLFTNLAATTNPASVVRIPVILNGYLTWFVRDPDQTTNTTIAQSFIDAVNTAEGAGPAAAALTAVQGILNRIRVKDLLNSYWVADDATQPLHAGHFGAVSDGAWNYAGAISGTDNTAAIQALIDWRQYLRQYTFSQTQECRIPPGVFRINNGLQLGYGDTFRQVVLRGAGPTFSGSGNGGGTTLVCDFDDRPAISIEGGRVSFAADMAIVSPRGLSWVYSKSLGSYNDTALISFGLDDKQLVNWFDPAYPTRSPFLRFNPHAAIAIDPYRGAQPAAAAAWAISTAIALGEYRTANSKLYIARTTGTTLGSGTGPAALADYVTDNTVTWSYVGPSTLSTFYPAATPPAFLPLANRVTYSTSKALSSNTPLSNVRMYGFTVGVAVQPCNDDSNADFTSLFDCEVTYGPFQLSVCNTQSRNVDARRMTGSNFHTAITTTKHGKQNGKLGGVYSNCSWSACYQLVDLGGTAIVGPHTFVECYVEGVQRIGDVSSGGNAGNAIVFDQCQFAFGHLIGNGRRGVPQSLLGNILVPVATGALTDTYNFRNCTFGGFSGMAPFLVAGVKLDNCTFTEVANLTMPAQWRARAYNTTAGGVVFPSFVSSYDQLIHYIATNETTLGQQKTLTNRVNKATSRDLPASIYTPSLSPTLGNSSEEITNPVQIPAMAKTGAGATCSLSGVTLTITTTFNDQTAIIYGMVIGAVLFDDNDGKTYIVRTRTGASGAYVYTCDLQTGYSYSVGGAIAYATPFLATVGNLYSALGGVFSVGYPMFGTLSTGGTAIPVARNDGYGGFIANTAGSMIQTNDRPFVDGFIDGWSTNGFNAVTATAAGSITIASAPSYNATGKRLQLWIRGS